MHERGSLGLRPLVRIRRYESLGALIAGATAQAPRDAALIRNRFMRGLGTGWAGALDG